MPEAVKTDKDFAKNEEYNKALMQDLHLKLAKIFKGGGDKSAARQKEKGKLLARERVEYLIDK